jgi:hypothetical protein
MSHDWGSVLCISALGLYYLGLAKNLAGKSGDSAHDRSQSTNYRLLGTAILLIAAGFGWMLTWVK